MRFNKKTNYFVSKKEFKKMNKNPFIAGVLSIILGMFGVHRFYLKRKWTGLIFCILSISSVQSGGAYLAAILMIISIIEGILYIIRGIAWLKEKYVDIKIAKNKWIKEIKSSVNEEKNKMDVKEKIIKTNEREEIGKVKIIEVSNIPPMKIPRKNESDNVFKTNWIKQLDLPYERSIMKVGQVKEETINLYENLCGFIDKELRSNKSSLSKEVRRISMEGGYYHNILYTIYCISEGHVTKTYSGSYHYYNPEYSYGILQEHFGKDLKNKIYNKAQELEDFISPPREETLKHFNLTENGLPIEWWDRDGRFRAKREFSIKEFNILRATPSRSTKVWELYEAKKQMITLYLEIWKLISNALGKDLKWKNKIKTTLKNIEDGKYTYFADYENGNILSSLIKISENTIREIMPNTQALNISNEKENIKRYLPSKVVEKINDKLLEYKEDIKDEERKEILKDMMEKDSNNWRLKAKKVLMADKDKKIGTLMKYEEDENFIKILKEIIKDAEDENLLLLCLYSLAREEKLSPKNLKLLESIIHPSNISIYESILQSKEALSLDLLDRLVKLKNPLRKKIELNMDKVKKSQKELNQTVEIVREYIGDENESPEIEKEHLKEEITREEYDEKLEFKHISFLKLILGAGSIEIEKGIKMAMDKGVLLNAFISDVNRELYEYIQDQAIVIEEDYIKIDDFYVDMVKELVGNEA